MSDKQHRKLAALLFADIVGYTAFMQKDEVAARQLLNKFYTTLNRTVEQNKGQVINNYGDGCLCTFDSAVAAVQCAKAVQQIFQTEPKVPVRIGLHSGDVFFEKDNVFGDSVNIAARIESLGIAGSILFSKRIKRHIANQTEFKVQSLGAFDFKNVEKTLEVFALTNEGFAIPKRAEMQGKLKAKKTKINQWQIPALLVAILAAATFYWFTNTNKTTLTEEIPSIAVLPFDDMSENKNQDYFADGIAEEILNTLVKLKELKVAGRTSSFSFKEKEATIAEIGKTLNVNHILEGSIRKQGNRIRITAQLIKVDDGFHVWSEKYDRDFDDIFAIQDELSQKIGQILLEKLAPEQISKLKTNTATPNSEAYELFLKAKHISQNRYLGQYNIEDFKLSEKLFLQAIEVDSNYAMAHAGLAELYDTHFLNPNGIDNIDRYEKLKLKESEIAFRLAPDNYYVNAARGWAVHSSAVDSSEFQEAFQCFLKAYQLNPQGPDGLWGLSILYRNKSLIDDAHQFLNKAIELDPLRATPYNYKAFLYRGWEGKYEEASHIQKTFLELVPEAEQPLRNLALDYAFMNRKKEAVDILSQLQNRDSTVFERHPFYKKIFLILKDDFTNAEKIPIDSEVFYFLKKDWEGLEKRAKSRWERLKSLNREGQSYYIRLEINPMYDKMREQPWFQEALKEEKEKYDQFYKEFPRAEAIIGRPIKG